MKLINAKKYSNLVLESIAPGSLYRIMDIDEFANIFRGKWSFSPSSYENDDIDHNFIKNNKTDQEKLKNSEVYNKNKQYKYHKSFTRSINPTLISTHFNEETVIVEFDKEELSNFRNSKMVPTDYQPYGKAHNGNELEDRLYQSEENVKFDPKTYNFSKLIKVVYFSEELADEIWEDIEKLKSKGIKIGIIPYMDDYSKLTLTSLKQFLK